MRDLDLPFFTTFLTVYELQSLTAATQRLHRTQPTLSYQLRQLENVLGSALFTRQGRRLVPTPTAERLHRLGVAFREDLRRVLAGTAEPDRLAIAAVAGFGRYVLMPRLVRMRPLPSVMLQFPTADEVFRRVADGEAHVGFVHRTAEREGLTLEPVFTESFVLLAGRSWASRLRRPRDFEGAAVVTYDEGDYLLGRWLGHHFGHRAPAWHAASHCEDLEEVVSLVAAGAGVAVVPHFMQAAKPALRRVTWGRRPVQNTIFALRRIGSTDSAVLAALLATFAARQPRAGRR